MIGSWIAASFSPSTGPSSLPVIVPSYSKVQWFDLALGKRRSRAHADGSVRRPLAGEHFAPFVGRSWSPSAPDESRRLTSSRFSGAVKVTTALAAQVVRGGFDLGVDHVAGDVQRGALSRCARSGAASSRANAKRQSPVRGKRSTGSTRKFRFRSRIAVILAVPSCSLLRTQLGAPGLASEIMETANLFPADLQDCTAELRR